MWYTGTPMSSCPQLDGLTKLSNWELAKGYHLLAAKLWTGFGDERAHAKQRGYRLNDHSTSENTSVPAS